ncbi:hypothetical protein C8J57DRAFT_1229694 [Mycena rebaudengoi]|nr:hypothetical protein C8J57DRAFT_1229694 [Mycena rebaudengoi]
MSCQPCRIQVPPDHTGRHTGRHTAGMIDARYFQLPIALPKWTLDAEVDLVIQLSKLSQRHSGVSRDLPATPTPPHPDAITPNYVLAVVKTALTCPYIYSVQNANIKYLVRFVVVVLSTLRIGTSTSSV